MASDDWREAIRQYDLDVADGTIQFGVRGFADEFPGKDVADKSIAELVREHRVTE